MTVQDIINAVSTDTRQVLSNAGNDAVTILNWVDRVQKEVLHLSNFISLNLQTTSITTTVGTTSYVLPVFNIRRIVSVYDITFNRVVSPSDMIFNPTPVASRVDDSQGRSAEAALVVAPHQIFKYGGTPEYYRYIAEQTMTVIPAATDSTYLATLNVVYEELVPTLTTTAATLTLPDDAKDVVVAGVNWMAMAYIGKMQEAQMWYQVYSALKAGDRIGIIR